MFVDLDQYKKISQAQATASSAVSKVESIHDTIRHLEITVSEQKIVIQALAELMISKGICTKDELLQLMADIDGRDGLIDGKMATNVESKCEKCARPYNITINKCQYCGHVNAVNETIQTEYRKSISAP